MIKSKNIIKEDWDEKELYSFVQQMRIIVSYAKDVKMDKVEEYGKKYFRSAKSARKKIFPGMLSILKKVR
tara:strand:+ start:815 stop:1024 length:210 start_codon:yes stop_codon:yes gene_type:complete